MIIEKYENGIYKMLDLSRLPRRKYGNKEYIYWSMLKGVYSIPFQYKDLKGYVDLQYSHKNKFRHHYIKLSYKEKCVCLASSVFLKIGDKFRELVLQDLPDCLYNHEVCRFLKYPEQAKSLTLQSGLKIEARCPDCGTEKITTVNKLVNRGFRCKRCHNTNSYNEIMFEYYLDKLDIHHQTQTVREFNSKSIRFDFYIPAFNSYVELHGKQHYTSHTRFGEQGYKRSRYSDNLKRQYCEKEGCNLIEIDCRSDDLKQICEFINSKFSRPLGLSPITADLIHKSIRYASIKNQEIIRQYREGVPVYVISERFNITQTSINTKAKKYGVRKPLKKKVVNMRDKLVFPSRVSAAKYYSTPPQEVSKACAGQRHYSYYLNTKELIEWVNYEDYVEKYGTEGLTEYIEEPEKQTN